MRWWALRDEFLASVLLAFLVAVPAGVAFGSVGAPGRRGGRRCSWAIGAATRQGSEAEFIAGRHRSLGSSAWSEALDGDATAAIGVDANARAFLVVRALLERAVKVVVADAADPTPYWLVSTRHPATLAASLGARAVQDWDRPGTAVTTDG